MSAKMSKKTIQQTASSSTTYTTPVESTKSHQRSRSPLSPTRVSRMAEKDELQGLNERLAVYMDTVRTLVQDNNRLKKEAESYVETIQQERKTYNSIYDKELGDARRMLDDVSSAKAKLDIENKRLREEIEDLKSGLNKATKENCSLGAQLSAFEQRISDLQSKLNKANADLKTKEDDLRDLDRVKKALEQQKKCVEHETLARVELENKLQTLKEEMTFKGRLYEEEVTTLRTKRHQEITEIDGKLSMQYENKLQSALADLREQYEAQLQANRDETIRLYENKIRRMEDEAGKTKGDTQALVSELRSFQTRYNSVSSQMSALEATNANLKERVNDLERQLEVERVRSNDLLKASELEIAGLKDEMNQQLKEYQELMDIKTVLDSELMTYRKLLECEETRLNIVPSPLNRRGTPRRGTPVIGKAGKRRRINMESETDTFQVSGEAHTDIEISDVDPDGKFIQLHNKGDKELTIGGWVIKHAIGDESSDKETTFKLHRSVKIEAGGHVTVHSADAGRTHEPPQHIVMKTKWFAGDPAYTVLSNTEGEMVANRRRLRVQSSSYQEVDETDDTAGEKQECLIM